MHTTHIAHIYLYEGKEDKDIPKWRILVRFTFSEKLKKNSQKQT